MRAGYRLLENGEAEKVRVFACYSFDPLQIWKRDNLLIKPREWNRFKKVSGTFFKPSPHTPYGMKQ